MRVDLIFKTSPILKGKFFISHNCIPWPFMMSTLNFSVINPFFVNVLLYVNHVLLMFDI